MLPQVPTRHTHPHKTHEQSHTLRARALSDDLQFEDPFEDEILKVEDENAMVDEDGGMKDDDDDASESKRPAVYQPGVDSIGADEALDYDSTAYTTYHKMTGSSGWCEDQLLGCVCVHHT